MIEKEMIGQEDLRKQIREKNYYDRLCKIMDDNGEEKQKLFNDIIPAIIHHTIENYKQFEGNDKTIDSAREFLENIRQSMNDYKKDTFDKKNNSIFLSPEI